MKAKTIFQYALLFVSFAGFSQDPYLFNTSQSLVYLNPSFAGSNGGVRDQFMYRNHTPGLGAYNNNVTFLNTFDAYIKPLKGGLAVSALTDNVLDGRLKTNALSLTYAQHLSLNDGDLKIIPSLQFGYMQRSLEIRNLTFGDMIDPRMGVIYNNSSIQPEVTKRNVEISAGLLAAYKNFYAGVSAFHMNQPDVGLFGVKKLPVNINAHASYNLHVSEKTLFNFYIKNSVQDNKILTQAGANAVFFKHLVTGLGYFYRSNYYLKNNAQLSLGYRSSFMSIIFGLDSGWSTEYNDFGKNSYELSLSFNLRNKDNRRTLTNFETW